MGYPQETLPLAAVRIDGGTQARVRTDEEVVGEYANAYQDGKALPPAVVYHDGTVYWLADGFHRYLARKKAGAADILCEVRPGTKRDAILHACGANASHGLRRTRADMAKAVNTLLDDPEWSTWSVNAIAKACDVSWTFADRLVTSRAGSENDPETPAERSYMTRHGTPATMATENIGPAKASRKKPAKDPAPDADSDVDDEQQTHCVPTGPLDYIGLTTSGDSAEAFRSLDLFRELEKLLKQAGQLVNRLAKLPGAELYRQRLKLVVKGDSEHFHCPDLANALKEAQHAEPYSSVCPYCHHKHPGQIDPRCKACKGLPYLTREAFDRAPEDYRKAVLALARGDES